MIRALVSIAFFGALLVLISEKFVALAAALFLIGFCVLWVWAAKDDDDVRSMAEWSAEKRAREALADQHIAEMERKGRPFHV